MRKRKIFVRVTAVVAATLIMITTILGQMSQNAFAQQSFNGIDTIISSHGDDNPFTIVELVPDHSAAKLGYLVEGSEPFYYDSESGEYQTYTEHLASLTSTADRESFNSTMYSQLSLIIGDTTMPLSYTDYAESYVQQDGYTELELNESETLESGTSGYTMDDVGTGNGSYSYSTTYTPVGDSSGTLNQKVSYYDYQSTENKYYNLTFTVDSNITSESAYKVADNQATYYTTYDAAVEAAPNDVYYSIDNGTTFTKANGSNTETGGSYYVVYFTYVEDVTKDTSATDTSTNTTYYTVSNVSFDKDGGTYGAVLDAKEPYVDAGSSGGNFTSSGLSYQYVGAGNGAFNLVEDENGKLEATVTGIPSVYYTGGFTNNNLFKQYVFNQSGLLNAEGADISIQVVTLTPSEFETYTGSMDLLYISGSSALASNITESDSTDGSSGSSTQEDNVTEDSSTDDSSESSTQADSVTAYSSTNDISAAAAYSIYSEVVSESTYLPVMLDYSIFENTSLSGTNIYKLATLLTAEELSADNVTFDSATSTLTVADDIIEFSDADHHYVNENVYVIPGDTSDTTFIADFSTIFLDDTSKDEDTFSSDAEAIGFAYVADTIILENFYREVENASGNTTTYDLFEQKISKAVAVEYIISYAEKREEYVNYDIKVLDIEPSGIEEETEDEIEANIKEYLDITEDSTYTVTVTHMTSAEFICTVEDLSDYDMIYMGLYTDTMNTENGRTVYNDSDMNGLVYCNIGDYQYDSAAVGILDTDYQNTANHYSIYNKTASKQFWWSRSDSDTISIDYNQPWQNGKYECVRYSGNDFTDEKMNAMIAFAKSGLPVVLADDFLVTDASGTHVYDYKYDADGKVLTDEGNGYIDNCSKVYETIDAIMDYSNVMTESDLTEYSKQQMLLQYLTLGKPVLTVTTKAKESGQAYINTDGSTVSFDFSIANYGSADADATFNCMLYADFNADGRYSNSTELIGANDYTLTLDGVTQTVKSKTDDEGNTYFYYELSPNSSGTTYHLEYTLSDDYIGVIPIKIKVSQSSNDYRYDSEQMYFYKSNTSGEKVTIKVLQILPTTGTNVFNMGDDGELDGTLTSDTPFYQLIHSLEDYDIQIDAMKAENYADKYAEDKSFLDDYDMLILGFADCYEFIEGAVNDGDEVIAAYQGVHDFINSGKSVLFTHDTTSYSVNPNDDANWATDMNLLLPQDVGLDRYGLNTSYLLQAGLNLDKNDTWTTYNVSDFQSLEKAYDAGMLEEGKTTYTSSELFDYVVAESEENSKDIAYKPNSGKSKLVNSVQGRTNLSINYNSNSNSSMTYYSSAGVSKLRCDTTQVELVNEGQILVYPYNILDEMNNNGGVMTVAQTHLQYYQIDMNEDADKDGESDITVWLSLSGDDYAKTGKDGRNNYYIYTKGNVTYSGVGHMNINYTGNEAEIMLYINTMVAAYQAGAHAPTISVTQGEDSDSGDLTTIYVGFDSMIDANGNVEDGTQVDSGTETVYFTVTDTNVSRGGTKKLSADYYLIYGAESELPEGVTTSDSDIVNLGTEEEPKYAKKLEYKTYQSDGSEQDASNLTSGVTYHVEVPYDVINEVEDDTAELWICATTSIWNANADLTASPSGTYTSHKVVYVQKLGLFDLE